MLHVDIVFENSCISACFPRRYLPRKSTLQHLNSNIVLADKNKSWVFAGFASIMLIWFPLLCEIKESIWLHSYYIARVWSLRINTGGVQIKVLTTWHLSILCSDIKFVLNKLSMVMKVVTAPTWHNIRGHIAYSFFASLSTNLILKR